MSIIKPNSDGLVKIEIGCGNTKQSGYIGIDRFSLPNVDIVADLNEKFPLEDDTVDMLFASHSLEHLDDIEHAMSEIYRICKDKAIVYILAPYYHTGMNQANYYHKVAFNEDTFRFFSTNEANPWLPSEDWYFPLHSAKWGLSESDNSKNKTRFCQVHTEFFYFKAYRGLEESQKRHVRKAFQNVCDQLFYILLVDKNGISVDEANENREFALRHTPDVIEFLRARDRQADGGTSILDDIDERIQGQLALQCKECTARMAALESGVTALESGVAVLKRESQAMAATTAELLRSLEKSSRLYFKQREGDITQVINEAYPAFYDGLRQHRFEGKDKTLLLPSHLLGYNSYSEFSINADGIKLHLMFYGKYGSEVIIEVVCQNAIIAHNRLMLLDEGIYTMTIPHVQGSIDIRLQAGSANDIVKFLQIVSPRKLLFCKRRLAAYVD